MSYGKKIKRIYARTFDVKPNNRKFCHIGRFIVKEDEAFETAHRMEEYLEDGVSIIKYESKNFLANTPRKSKNTVIYSTK